MEATAARRAAQARDKCAAVKAVDDKRREAVKQAALLESAKSQTRGDAQRSAQAKQDRVDQSVRQQQEMQRLDRDRAKSQVAEQRRLKVAAERRLQQAAADARHLADSQKRAKQRTLRIAAQRKVHERAEAVKEQARKSRRLSAAASPLAAVRSGQKQKGSVRASELIQGTAAGCWRGASWLLRMLVAAFLLYFVVAAGAAGASTVRDNPLDCSRGATHSVTSHAHGVGHSNENAPATINATRGITAAVLVLGPALETDVIMDTVEPPWCALGDSTTTAQADRDERLTSIRAERSTSTLAWYWVVENRKRAAYRWPRTPSARIATPSAPIAAFVATIFGLYCYMYPPVICTWVGSIVEVGFNCSAEVLLPYPEMATVASVFDVAVNVVSDIHLCTASMLHIVYAYWASDDLHSNRPWLVVTAMATVVVAATMAVRSCVEQWRATRRNPPAKMLVEKTKDRFKRYLQRVRHSGPSPGSPRCTAGSLLCSRRPGSARGGRCGIAFARGSGARRRPRRCRSGAATACRCPFV